MSINRKSKVASIFLLQSLLLGSSGLFAQQQARISGKLVDNELHPIAHAKITLDKGPIYILTDNNGNFVFNNLENKSYVLTLNYQGKKVERKVTISEQGDQTLNWNLQAVHQIDSVSVFVNKKNVPSSTLRISENLLVTPQNIQVIDQSMLNDQFILSVAEGFTKNVSGARTIYHQEEASTGIAVRGFAASNLRNGMDVSGSFGPLREDMAFVERIEFVKGPAGFMMGNTQPGGFYNIVTKKPTGTDKSTARITLGSFNLYRAEADIDGKLSKDGKLLGRFNVMGTKKNSHINYTSNEQYVINPSLKYFASSDTYFTVEYIYSHNAFTGGFSKYAYGLNGFKEVPRDFSFNDPIIDPTVSKEHNIFGSVNHRLSDNWTLTGQFGYINSGMEGASLYSKYNSIDAEGNVYRGLSINDALNTSTVGQVFTRGKFTIGTTKSNVLIGLDMGTKSYVADWTALPDSIGGKFNIYNPKYGYLRKSDIPSYDRSRSLRERGAMYLQEYSYYSAHFQEELLLLNDKLRLGAGLRYTETSKKSPAANGLPVKNRAFTPRGSITGIITPELTVYALYDQSFQEQVGTLIDGGDAKASRGINTEVGVKKTWFDGRLMSSLTAYRVTKTNILTTAGPDFPGRVEQSGEALSKGIEVDINGKINDAFQLMINYAYTDAKVSKDNDPTKIGMMLYGTAKHITNAWLTYTVQQGTLKGVGLSAGYEYQAKRAAWPVTKEKYLPDDMFNLNLGASYKTGNYRINVLVDNVTNRYNYVGHFPGAWAYKHYGWRSTAPTNFRMSLAYDF